VFDAYANVGKVFDIQFVVEEKVEEAEIIVRNVLEAFACVRNVAIAQAVVDDITEEA
jgi:hypothetical protein